MNALPPKVLRPLIQRALLEDKASHDITSKSVLPGRTTITAALIAKEAGIAAGVKTAAMCFLLFDPKIRIRQQVDPGQRVAAGTKILTLTGPAQSIFAAERTALNFLGHLSGVATLTRAYVDKIKGTGAAILDTRKTLPGLRVLEKHAVCAGGGQNHRSNLSDAILIKTNHLRVAYSVQRLAYRKTILDLVKKAKQKAKGKFVEIEVANWKEFEAALEAHPDAILLDNWTILEIRRAVLLSAKRYPLNARPLLEYSGGVTLDNVRAIAKTGIDRISIGRLTHSAPSLDVSLQVSDT